MTEDDSAVLKDLLNIYNFCDMVINNKGIMYQTVLLNIVYPLFTFWV